MFREKVKRNYKDSIFRSLFNDEKELLQLYNALTGENCPEDTEIKIVTLDNAVFNDQKNDVAFIVNDKYINLTEQQSSLSPNMPLRFLEYVAKEYQKFYFSRAVYSTSQVKIPTPQFFVLYNGPKDVPLEQTVKLSDAFAGKYDTINLELIVKVINVNYDKGADILEKCRTLKEYSIFMHRVRTLSEEYGDLDFAIEESIKSCIADNILSGFLKENKGEVMSFLEVQLSAEEREAIREEDGYIRGRADGEKIGYETGAVEGREEATKKIIVQMLKEGMKPKLISKITGADEALIEVLRKEAAI